MEQQNQNVTGQGNEKLYLVKKKDVTLSTAGKSFVNGLLTTSVLASVAAITLAILAPSRD